MGKRSAFRLLDRALSGDTAARAAVAQSQELQAQLSAMEQVQLLLREGAARRAPDPFLAEHVIRRLNSRAHGHQDLYGALLAVFRPMAIAALLLIASMAAYNVTFRTEYSSAPTAAEVMLGLQPVTLTEAFVSELMPEFPADP